MAGKSRTHSENWWAENSSPLVLRCTGHYKSTGEQCRRVAEDGAVVCDQHGAAAAQVRRRAAERIAMTADAAVQGLTDMLNDPQVPHQVKMKVRQDLLDRAGLGGAQVHKIMPITEDPIEAFFKSLLDRPDALVPDAPALAASPSPSDYDSVGLPRPAVIDTGVEHTGERRSKPPKLSDASRPPRHIREGLSLP